MTTPDHLQHQEELHQIFERIEHSEDHIFITGKAGTGKSTLLSYIRRHTHKKTVVLAPTGVAALNVRGQTIHSFFKFKPRFQDINAIKQKKRKSKLYGSLELLIIDEISMVRADVFDAIERFLCLNGPTPGLPFGGVQVCVVGDLFQLPPVVSGAERELYQQHYTSAFFFSSHAYKKAGFAVLELHKIFRQLDNDFIRMLNIIRQGRVNPETIGRINSQVGADVGDHAVILTSTNALAERTNQAQLEALNTKAYTYVASQEGAMTRASGNMPAPEELVLKEGAHVMLTRNDPKRRWVNGTLAIVSSLTPVSVEVQITKDGRNRHYTIEQEEWESIEYKVNEESGVISENVVGVYRQYPLIHAWAITIHKSQGKTIDEIVIDLGSGAFAAGQLYVALSRCPSLERISLVSPITAADVRADPIVNKFYDYYQEKMKKLSA